MFDPGKVPHFRMESPFHLPVAQNEQAHQLHDAFRQYAGNFFGKQATPASQASPSFFGTISLSGKSYAIIVQSADQPALDIFLVPSEKQAEGQNEFFSNSFFRRILDNLPTEIAVFDREFRYRYVNRHGIKNEEIRKWIIGKTDYEYCDYRQRDYTIADGRTRSFRKAWDEQQEIEWEEEQKQSDGDVKYFLRRVTPVIDEQGNTILIIGYGMDITDLKKARIRLLISEEKYRHLVEESSDILYTTDAEGNFTFINKVAEKITGFSLDEIIGRPYTDFIRADFVQKAYEFYTRQRDTSEENSYFEFPIVTLDGSEMWVGQKVRMIYDSSGFIGVMAIARDITELKKAEHELMALIASLDDIVMEVDEEFRFLNVWTANEKELFLPVNEVMGRSMREILGEDFSRPFEEEISRVIQDGISRTIEYKHPFRNEWYSAKLNLLADEGLREKRISLLIRNITEIRIARENLVRNQENLFALIENTNDIVYSIDTSYRLLSFNARFAGIEKELYGWEPCVGCEIPFHLNEDYRKQEWQQIYSEAFAGRSSQEEIILTLGKQSYVFEYSLTPIRSKDDTVIGVAVFGRDITSRKKAEKQLLRAQKIALQSNKSREQFIATMSHELRTPIHTILGSSQLLDNEKLDNTQKEYLSAIRDSSRFLLSMINDILDLSKIDSGKIVFENISFSFGEIKRALQLNFGEQARAKGVLLNLHADDSLLSQPFSGDPNKIRQVLVNLIGNALKFTETGSIDVYFESRSLPGQRAELAITVRDTGIGMTALQMKRIFKPFGQGSDSISKKYGGSGLGLIISKKIIQSLSGTISTESSPGKGSSFRVVFSLPFAEQTDAEKTSAIPLFTGDKPSLLLVEDHDFNRFFMKRILQQKGFTVFEAENGEKALQVLSEHSSIALVLLDLRMPGWDGYTTNRKIRKLRGASLPVIALTAYTLQEEQKKCREEGFAGFVVKPVDPDELERIIFETLHSEKQTAPVAAAAFSLNQIHDLFDSDDAVNEMIGLFLKNAGEYSEQLSSMLRKNDFSLLPGLMHKLKPTSILFSMEAIQQLAERTELPGPLTAEDNRMIAEKTRKHLEEVSLQIKDQFATAGL